MPQPPASSIESAMADAMALLRSECGVSERGCHLHSKTMVNTTEIPIQQTPSKVRPAGLKLWSVVVEACRNIFTASSRTAERSTPKVAAMVKSVKTSRSIAIAISALRLRRSDAGASLCRLLADMGRSAIWTIAVAITPMTMYLKGRCRP